MSEVISKEKNNKGGKLISVFFERNVHLKVIFTQWLFLRGYCDVSTATRAILFSETISKWKIYASSSY